MDSHVWSFLRGGPAGGAGQGGRIIALFGYFKFLFFNCLNKSKRADLNMVKGRQSK